VCLSGADSLRLLSAGSKVRKGRFLFEGALLRAAGGELLFWQFLAARSDGLTEIPSIGGPLSAPFGHCSIAGFKQFSITRLEKAFGLGPEHPVAAPARLL
jgi:hypothetical protein